MKRVIVKGMVPSVFALLCAAVWWHAPAGAAAGGESGGAQKSRAREVFDQRCARCHGRDGRGATRLGEMLGTPDFTDEEWWRGGVTDARLKTSISDGKGEMPAFGKKLSRTEISSLVEYVRSLKGRRQ